MKQRIKKENNRKKADFGLTAALITLAGSLASAGINSYTQNEIAKKQRRQQLLADNQANALQAAANQSQALNYEQQNELETLKTGNINSLNSQSSQFEYGGNKPRPKFKRYKHYTDPYAKSWYRASFNPTNSGFGRTKTELRDAALNAANYVESMYRYHQKKYLANRTARESNPNFIGPPAPVGYIPDTIKQGLQFENYDSRVYGPYNNNYPDLPEDYDKYKCGGKKRMKKGGNVTFNLNNITKYI